MYDNTSIVQQPHNSPTAAANEVAPVQEINEHELVDRFPVQLKLSVGAPNDPLEHEADAMADKVMRMPENALVQRKASSDCCDYDDEHVHLKPLSAQVTPFIQAKSENGGTVSNAVTDGISATQGGGSAMADRTKSFMESRFGNDFSNVRIHTGDYAVQMSKDLNAQAFTTGNDVYFNSGKYAPENPEGKHLLAHELTHVVQQSGSVERKIQRHPPRNNTSQPVPQPPAQPAAPQTNAPAQPAPPAQPAAPQANVPAQPSPPAPPAAPQANAPAQPALPAQPAAPQANAPAPPQAAPPAQSQQPAQPAQPAQQAVQPAQHQTQDLRSRVRAWLDTENFGLPIVADSASTASGARRAYYGGQMSTLDQITTDTTNVLHQTDATVERPNVWMQVWQYYNEKRREAELTRWQTIVQFLYTPQYTLATSAPGGSPWQHGFQFSAGRNFRFHQAGSSGLELTLQGSLALFNFGTGPSATAADIFQNLTGAAQLQYVWNLGNEFQLPTGQWANVQASLFGQLAGGLGTNWVDIPMASRTVFVGLLLQPSVGGQVNLNIGSFQVILNGSIVGSFLSPTTQRGSSWTSAVGFQGGIGVGGQF